MEFGKYNGVEQVRTLIKFMSNDKTRLALNYIYVEDDCEGSIMVATDGKKLCTFKIPQIEAGFYRVIKNTKSLVEILKTDVDATYPKWRAVIPDTTDYVEFYANGIDSLIHQCSRLGVYISIANTPIDKEYMKVKVSYNHKPVMIKSGDLMAIIMPVLCDYMAEDLLKQKLAKEQERK